MMHSKKPAFAKPLGLLLVCGLIGAPACGKKDEPEAPKEDAPAEVEAAPEEPKAEDPKGAVKADATEGNADAESSAERPRRERPVEATRPGRRGPRDGDGGEPREGRPRIKGGERPAPMPRDEAAPDAGKDPEVVAAPEVKPGTPPGEAPEVPPEVAPEGAPQPVADAPARPAPVAAVPVQPLGPTPDASVVLPFASVAELIKGKKLAAAGPLPGIAVQPGYSSMLYATADGKSLGVSLQIWQDPARRESDDRYRRMRLQYPKAEDVTALPPAKAFYSYFSGVQTLTFVDSVKRVVASISCGEGVCSHQQLLALAKLARERL